MNRILNLLQQELAFSIGSQCFVAYDNKIIERVVEQISITFSNDLINVVYIVRIDEKLVSFPPTEIFHFKSMANRYLLNKNSK